MKLLMITFPHTGTHSMRDMLEKQAGYKFERIRGGSHNLNRSGNFLYWCHPINKGKPEDDEAKRDLIVRMAESGWVVFTTERDLDETRQSWLRRHGKLEIYHKQRGIVTWDEQMAEMEFYRPYIQHTIKLGDDESLAEFCEAVGLPALQWVQLHKSEGPIVVDVTVETNEEDVDVSPINARLGS